MAWVGLFVGADVFGGRRDVQACGRGRNPDFRVGRFRRRAEVVRYAKAQDNQDKKRRDEGVSEKEEDELVEVKAVAERKQRAPHSKETKKRISRSLKGRKVSEETKEKIRQAVRLAWARKTPGERAPRRAKEMSKETRNKISDSLRGRKLSPEVRAKISEALRGRKFSDEHKQALSERFTGEKNPMYGRVLTEETKRMIAEKANGRVLTEETKQRISKKMKERMAEKAKASQGNRTDSPTKEKTSAKSDNGGRRGRQSVSGKKRETAKKSDGKKSKQIKSESTETKPDQTKDVGELYAAEEYDSLLEDVLTQVELPRAVKKALNESKAQMDARKQEEILKEEVLCPSCGGEGTLRCSNCLDRLGVVSSSCTKCMGTGFMFCGTCDGSGEFQASTIKK